MVVVFIPRAALGAWRDNIQTHTSDRAALARSFRLVQSSSQEDKHTIGVADNPELEKDVSHGSEAALH